MFKLIFLGIAAYLAYTYFIKPKTLVQGKEKFDDDHDDQYVDYEEIND